MTLSVTANPKTFRAFDAGQGGRRLRALPISSLAINGQIRAYGKTMLARSRYLTTNNPYASAAKEAFVSSLAGTGIKPSILTTDIKLKAEIQELFLEWTDESDADDITDFFGLQSLAASEMFEAGECFVRLRQRREDDGLSVPIQLQILPAEMLPLNLNRTLNYGFRIESGIEFNPIGQRVAYHFYRSHPGNDVGIANPSETVRVPSSEVLHLYRPIRAGQIRGIPHTIASIATLALLDMYDDAELERKRIAALFAAFVTRPPPDVDAMQLPGNHPLADGSNEPGLVDPSALRSSEFALEPGATIDLEPGEDVKFSEPADVGGTYEVFQYRNLLRAAAGFGVPYADMTGDLRQTSYGSIRAGLIQFRRRIEAMQHHVMVYQFCRPVWRRWIQDAVLSGALAVTPALAGAGRRQLMRVKWIPPKWEWIDPLKDRQAEKLAVDEGFKSRSDVQEAEGHDPEETDRRIMTDYKREDEMGLVFGKRADREAAEANANQVPPTQERAE